LKINGACLESKCTYIGTDYSVVFVLMTSATFGTFTYNLVKGKHPHYKDNFVMSQMLNKAGVYLKKYE